MMRQPSPYLLIGNGRVARHFQHYFSLLQLPFLTWNRKQPVEILHQHLTQCSHILLLINDTAIERFFQTHLISTNALCIHFSGSLVSESIYGAHPLMTFGEHLYDSEQYQTIPFILDHDAPSFETLLPGLTNQHFRLSTSLKEKYHALCVLGGNFSCMLWQKLFESFEHELGLPSAIAHPYLVQQTKNLIHDAKSALTGPLIRNDIHTIEKNLAALNQDPFLSIYENFVACYQQLKEKNKS